MFIVENKETYNQIVVANSELFLLKMLVSCISGCDSVMEPSEDGNETLFFYKRTGNT